MKFFTFLTLFVYLQICNAQEITMKVDEGTTIPDIVRLNKFEGIYSEKFTFTGKELIGKNYQINCKEFKDGNLIKTSKIFDSSEDEYFRLKNESLEFYVYSKVEDNQFKIQLQFNGFSSTKKYAIIESLKEDYVLKNFLGAENESKVNANANYFLTFMTPYTKEDGFKTYCEVAQSDVNPEELGKKYNLLHYFLMEIKFY